MAALGIETTREQANIILVDATTLFEPEARDDTALIEGSFDPLADELAPQLSDGATVVLHGLTPQNIGRWRKLIPPSIELATSDARHCVRVVQSPWLAGISASDLWWAEYPMWDRNTEKGGLAMAYSVQVKDPESAWRELVAPGALVEISVGDGRLLIDQLLWDKQDVHKERSGQYAALLVGNLIDSPGDWPQPTIR